MFDPLYETADPNGRVSAQRGKLALFKNGSEFEVNINTDGENAWQNIFPFKTGDLIMSSVTTARTGWTEITSTYADKYIRVGSTGLATGGNTSHDHTVTNHSHGVGSFLITTTVATVAGGGPNYSAFVNGTTTVPVTGTSAAAGAETTSSADNDPAYVDVRLWQKD